MDILSSIGMFIMSLPAAAWFAVVWMLLCLVFRAGIHTSIRAGLSVGVGLIGVVTLSNLMADTLKPVVDGLSTTLGLNLHVMDLGVGAILNVFAWPGSFVVMFGIIGIGIVLALLKLTNSLWVDVHNTWHGNFVGLLTWVMTQNVLLSIGVAFITMIISLKLADYHAKKFQEYTGVPNITLIDTMATLPATLSMLLMKVLDKIPGLNKVTFQAEDLKDKIGVFGETMTIGAIMGAIMAVIAGLPFSQVLSVVITLAATLALIPKMAGLLLEGMVPLSTAVTAVAKKRFKGRQLNITVDGAILLGHPAVMSTFALMVPISVLLSFIIPGIGFIPVASLIGLPYFIGAIMPYTRGSLLHALIITTIWVIIIGLIATTMAPVITHGLEITGFYQDQIAEGALFTCWNEGGNIFTWIIHLFIK